MAPAIGPDPLPGGNVSTLVAYDPVKQEIRWRVPVGNSRFGGTLSTASNLLFQVAPDGRLIAWSADKGDMLLELPTGLQNGMGPPITFAIDGKQYIALMGGSGGIESLGVTNPGSDDVAVEAPIVGIWPRRQGDGRSGARILPGFGGSSPIARPALLSIGFRRAHYGRAKTNKPLPLDVFAAPPTAATIATYCLPFLP